MYVIMVHKKGLGFPERNSNHDDLYDKIWDHKTDSCGMNITRKQGQNSRNKHTFVTMWHGYVFHIVKGFHEDCNRRIISSLDVLFFQTEDIFIYLDELDESPMHE